jgi:hypothetical protein
MLRTVIAAFIGSVLAVVAAFIVVAVICAIGGIEEMYTGRLVYGWDGAQRGMLFLVFFGVVKVWPFPAIALAGAMAGVIVGLVLQQRAARATTPLRLIGKAAEPVVTADGR